jgi:glycopeptide antibiotics resistance protein
MGIRIDSGNALFIGIVLWMVIRCLALLINKRYKQFSVKREFLTNIFAVYFIAVISITLFPIDIVWGEVTPRFRPAVNIIPFVDIITDFPQTRFSMAFKIKFLIKNLAGNLMLLLPLVCCYLSCGVRHEVFRKPLSLEHLFLFQLNCCNMSWHISAMDGAGQQILTI